MSAEQMRKAMNTLVEAASADEKPKSVIENIATLRRHAPLCARYYFNKGYLTFMDMMDNPKPQLELYRKESKREITNLVNLLSGMKPDDRYTGKEHYLRIGYEARGFSNGNIVLVWLKDKQESLFIFARDKDTLMSVRDFLKHFNIIRYN